MRLVLCSLLVLLLAPAVARAQDKPKEKVVNATKVFRTGENPADPGNCVTALFAEYKEIKNYSAIEWRTTLYSESGTTRESSGQINAPYDDVFTFGALRWQAPKHKHWSLVGKSWADGPPGHDHCATPAGKYPQIFRGPVKITYRSNEGTARIYGRVEPVTAFTRITPRDGDLPSSDIDKLPQEEITKLLSGLTVIAKGPKKTFKAPVLPDSAEQGYFKMEIPGRYYGRYTLSMKAPKGISAEPAQRTVRIKPGVEERADWELGYDCSVPPPGMKFAPRRDSYVSTDGAGVVGVELQWNCRARAARLRVHVTKLNGNPNDFDLKCGTFNMGNFWAGGATPAGWLESRTMRISPTGELGPSDRVYGDVFTFKGLFANANLFRASIRSPGCGYDIGGSSGARADRLQGERLQRGVVDGVVEALAEVVGVLGHGELRHAGARRLELAVALAVDDPRLLPAGVGDAAAAEEHRVLDAVEVAAGHLVAGLGVEDRLVLLRVERGGDARLAYAALEVADHADVAPIDDLEVVALDRVEAEVARLEQREAAAGRGPAAVHAVAPGLAVLRLLLDGDDADAAAGGEQLATVAGAARGRRLRGGGDGEEGQYSDQRPGHTSEVDPADLMFVSPWGGARLHPE